MQAFLISLFLSQGNPFIIVGVFLGFSCADFYAIKSIAFLNLKMTKMYKLFSVAITAAMLVTTQACKKNDARNANPGNLPSQNSTPAELLETEWLTSKFAVWNGYRIYHNGEFYHPGTKVWYSGRTDPADLDPDGGTGLYFGSKHFVTTIVSSSSSGGGCRTNSAFYTEGIPEFTANKIIFHPVLKRGISKSVCSPDNNYEKDFPVTKEEYAWTLGTIPIRTAISITP
jgi:hypothetical protein